MDRRGQSARGVLSRGLRACGVHGGRTRTFCVRSASFGKSWVIEQALVVVRDRSLQGFARRLLRSHPN